jgi:hypothetical protein
MSPSKSRYIVGHMSVVETGWHTFHLTERPSIIGDSLAAYWAVGGLYPIRDGHVVDFRLESRHHIARGPISDEVAAKLNDLYFKWMEINDAS